jgi:hypothetical protein
MQTRFDTEARIAVTQAADIARELGHREVASGHLLAGLLANPRGTAYAALRDHGLDLDTARALVATHHVDPEPEHDHDTDDEDKSAGYDEDREALKAIGIDLDSVREAVRANLGDDLAERWADRPRRDRGRSRRSHRHGHQGQGRGRRGPRSRRDGLRFSRELRALLRDARRAVLRDRMDADDDGGDRDAVRRVPGLTGARLLVALTRSDDPAVQAVLATSTGLDGLRAQAEAAVLPTTNA